MTGGCLSRDPPDIEDILKLNPKFHRYANAKPSVVTKKVIIFSSFRVVSMMWPKILN